MTTPESLLTWYSKIDVVRVLRVYASVGTLLVIAASTSTHDDTFDVMWCVCCHRTELK